MGVGGKRDFNVISTPGRVWWRGTTWTAVCVCVCACDAWRENETLSCSWSGEFMARKAPGKDDQDWTCGRSEAAITLESDL